VREPWKTKIRRPEMDVLIKAMHAPYISRKEKNHICDYLKSQGVKRDSHRETIASYCNGRYDLTYEFETWSGTGYSLDFMFVPPNPVGENRNGWEVSGVCPEWTAEKDREDTWLRDAAAITAVEWPSKLDSVDGAKEQGLAVLPLADGGFIAMTWNRGLNEYGPDGWLAALVTPSGRTPVPEVDVRDLGRRQARGEDIRPHWAQ
jgi:hypothetical protein